MEILSCLHSALDFACTLTCTHLTSSVSPNRSIPGSVHEREREVIINQKLELSGRRSLRIQNLARGRSHETDDREVPF